jgi:hypothetical protein
LWTDRTTTSVWSAPGLISRSKEPRIVFAKGGARKYRTPLFLCGLALDSQECEKRHNTAAIQTVAVTQRVLLACVGKCGDLRRFVSRQDREAGRRSSRSANELVRMAERRFVFAKSAMRRRLF